MSKAEAIQKLEESIKTLSIKIQTTERTLAEARMIEQATYQDSPILNRIIETQEGFRV